MEDVLSLNVKQERYSTEKASTMSTTVRVKTDNEEEPPNFSNVDENYICEKQEMSFNKGFKQECSSPINQIGDAQVEALQLQELNDIVNQYNNSLKPETNQVSPPITAQKRKEETRQIKTEPVIKAEDLEHKTESIVGKDNPIKTRHEGHVITTITKLRIVLCKLCLAQVPSIAGLAIHLDREHNISVHGPPRIADEWDSKEDLKNTSNFLKSIENKARSSEVQGESESDSSPSDDNYDDDEDSSLKGEEDEVEQSYIKLKTRILKRMMRRETIDQRRIETYVKSPLYHKEMRGNFQCNICWVENSLDEKFGLLRVEHKRQHDDGEFKVCPHCGMCFLYEHYLEKHLEDLRVPTVPPNFTPSEANDLLYLSHTCPVEGCDAEFTNRKCLLFHRTNLHDHLHRCSICEKSYVLFSRLRTHVERSHNYETRQLSCPVPLCDKSFSNRKGISTHMVHGHTKEEKEEWFPFNKANHGDDMTPVDKSNQTHSTPQTFWRFKNSQFLKSLARRAKRKKIPRRVKSLVASKPIELDQPNSKTSIVKKPGQFHLTQLCSLPPQIDGVDFIRRNRSRHSGFQHVCYYCSRAFKTVSERNAHMASTHKVDLSLERPHICPIPKCENRGFLQAGHLIRHIRDFHARADEDKLWRQSLQEDNVAESELSVKIKNKQVSDSREKEVKKEKLPQPKVKVKLSLGKKNAKVKWQKVVFGSSSKWSRPPGQSPLIRQVLSKFKLGTGYYCPECPLDKRKSFFKTWNVHRHLDTIHPNSTLLRNPGSVKLEVLRNGGNTLASSEVDHYMSGEDDQEVEPPGLEDEQELDLENYSDSDIITSNSSPETLHLLRELLTLSNRCKLNGRSDPRVSCPLCPAMKVFTSIHNLQRHFLNTHKDTDYHRKSKLHSLIEKQKSINAKAGGGKFKEGIPAKNRRKYFEIRKLKLKTKERIATKEHIITIPTPDPSDGLYSYLSKCKVGSIFYCPICHTNKNPRVYTESWNVNRHIKIHHPQSDLLKLPRGRWLEIKQDVHKDKTHAEDNGWLSDGSELEIAPPPKQGDEDSCPTLIDTIKVEDNEVKNIGGDGIAESKISLSGTTKTIKRQIKNEGELEITTDDTQEIGATSTLREYSRRCNIHKRPKYCDNSSDDEDDGTFNSQPQTQNNSAPENKFYFDREVRTDTSLSCKICSKKCHNKNSLRAHSYWCRKRTGDAGAKIPLICVKCHIQFNNHPSLQVHMTRCKRKGSTCHQSGSTPTVKEAVRRLRKFAASQTTKPNSSTKTLSTTHTPFKCPFCRMTFNTHQGLAGHSRWHHGDISDTEKSKHFAKRWQRPPTQSPKKVKPQKVSPPTSCDEDEIDMASSNSEDDDDLVDEVRPPRQLGEEVDPSQDREEDASTNETSPPDCDEGLLAIMENSTVLQENCMFCDDWFSSPQEKMHHVCCSRA